MKHLTAVVLLFAAILLPLTLHAQNWNTEIVQTLDLGLPEAPSDIKLEDDVLMAWYFDFGWHLWAWDVSDLFNPIYLGEITTTYTINRVNLFGDVLYVGMSNETRVFYVNSWSDPVDLGLFVENPNRMVFRDSLLFTFSTSSISIYDYTSYTNPQLLSEINTFSYSDFAFYDDFLFLKKEGYEIISIIDVHDPTAPYLAETFHSLHIRNTDKLGIQDGRLYYQAFNNEYNYGFLAIMEITNIDHFVQLGQHDNWVMFDYFHENFGYYDGRIFDLTYADNLVQRGNFNFSTYNSNAAHAGPYMIYIPDDTWDYNLVSYLPAIESAPITHFNPVAATGLGYPVAIQQADFEGTPLQPGDEIALYDNNLCVGAARVTGTWPLAVMAWQQQPGELPGFVPGERIQFRIWCRDSEQEHPASAEFAVGNGYFGTGIGSSVSMLHGLQEQEQTVYLSGDRWELISFNLRPAWTNADNVFGSAATIQAAVNDHGGLWLPSGMGNLTVADPREGYGVYSSAPITLHLTGAPLSPNLIHTLETGQWNYLAYTLSEPSNPAVALADIVDQVVVLMNDNGEFWWPGVMQTLPEMVPGDGYRIWVNHDVNFTYNSQQTDAEIIATPRATLPAAPSAPPSSGIGWLARVQVDESLIERDAEIVELLADGTVVGSGFIDETGSATLICWEGDRALGIPGFAAGSEMTVQIRDSHQNKLACVIAGVKPRFGERPVTSLTVTASSALPTRFEVSAVTPNPFNPTFTMTLQLPTNEDVRIRVFDVLGREVAAETLRGRYAGQTKWTFDAGQHNLASGLYLVQVRFGTETVTRKAMLLK